MNQTGPRSVTALRNSQGHLLIEYSSSTGNVEFQHKDKIRCSRTYFSVKWVCSRLHNYRAIRYVKLGLACMCVRVSFWMGELMKGPLCRLSTEQKSKIKRLLIFSVRFQFMKGLTSLPDMPCLSSSLPLFAWVYLSPDIHSVTEIHFTTVTPAELNPPRATPSSEWRADSQSFALVKVCLCFVNVF